MQADVSLTPMKAAMLDHREEAVQAAAIVRRVAPVYRSDAVRMETIMRDVGRIGPQCSTCNQRQRCIPLGLEAEAVRSLDGLVTTRIRLRKGETLYRAADHFAALHGIRSGSCKTVLSAEDGNEQVSGYFMPGDVLGSDGVATGVHAVRAVALEDTELCTIPFERIERLARDDRRVQSALHRLLAREIAREHGVMLMLGTMCADQRLATYLLDLSRRYHSRGYSSSEFVLRMTREEIGSYLGLKLETVSRLFSRFQREGLIQVQGRVIKLLDHVALKQLVTSPG